MRVLIDEDAKCIMCGEIFTVNSIMHFEAPESDEYYCVSCVEKLTKFMSLRKADQIP